MSAFSPLPPRRDFFKPIKNVPAPQVILRLRPRVQNLVHVSLWAHSRCMHHFWCLLWDHWTHFGHWYVCKGWWWGSECPRKEVQRSAKPFGRIIEGQGQEELLMDPRTERKESPNRNKIPRLIGPKLVGGEYTCIYNQASSPQRKSSCTSQN